MLNYLCSSYKKGLDKAIPYEIEKIKYVVHVRQRKCPSHVTLNIASQSLETTICQQLSLRPTECLHTTH